MNPIRLKRPEHESWEQCVYAKDGQPDENGEPRYRPLPAVKNVDDPRVPVVTVWEPDEDEIELLRQQLAVGQVRISLMQCTFGQPLQPVKLEVGAAVPGIA